MARIRNVSIEIFSREAPGITTAQPRFYATRPPHLGLLRVTDEDGVEGNAFIGSAPEEDLKALAAQVVNMANREVVGKDATERERLWSQLRFYTFYGRTSAQAWSAIDVALWDLAGKRAGLPIYQLIGAQRHSVPAYASSPYYPEVQGYVDEVLRYRAAGFTGYKIHPAGVPVARVKEVTTAVREAVGSEMRLMLDTSLCYDYEDAFEIGKHIQSLDYYWYEDPVRYSDFDAIDELARRLDIPIAVTDYGDFRFHEAAQMLRRRNGVRILRGDSMKGGITGLRKLCALAEGFALRCEVHSSVNSLMNAANLHVILSIANCDFYELIVPPEIFQFGMSRDIEVGKDGNVQAPTEPGLGFAIDFELIRRRLVERIA